MRSGNGKISWLVRSSRMDLAFRLVESQTRAVDDELAVKDLLDYNRIVEDARKDKVEVKFMPIPMENMAVIAVGDSSFSNVGKNKTASQAGLIILVADNAEGLFEKGHAARVSAMVWRSHRV